jgi:hypothetical protein
VLITSCLQADSGYDEGLYRQLSVAPVVLLDGRSGGSSEHAGFDQLQGAGETQATCRACWQATLSLKMR